MSTPLSPPRPLRPHTTTTRHPLVPSPPLTHQHTHTLPDTTYLSPPLLVLPNGASPQASKSNPSTNTVGIYLEWAFVLFNV